MSNGSGSNGSIILDPLARSIWAWALLYHSAHDRIPVLVKTNLTDFDEL